MKQIAHRIHRLFSGPAAVDAFFVLGWGVLLAFLMSRHVPWRDEYQSWLVSTRSTSWGEFFEAIRYERNPPLLYLLQRMVFAAARGLQWAGLGPDPTAPIYFRLLTYVFSLASVGLIVLRSGLPRWIRYLIPFSIFILLDYGVISRGYPIGVFLVFLSTDFFLLKKRKLAWISLGLASLVHLMFLAMAGVLLLIQLWEIRSELRKQWRSFAPAITLALSMMLLSAWTQRPPADSSFPTEMHVSWHIGTSLVHQLAWGLSGVSDLSQSFVWNSNGFDRFPNSIVLLWLILPASAVFFGFPMHYFLLLSAFPLVFVATTYHPASRYIGFVFLSWIICFWMRRQTQREISQIVFGILLLFSAATTASWLLSWNPFTATPAYDFSGSGELMESIGSQLKDPDTLIVGEDEMLAFPVNALTGKSTFIVGRNEFLGMPDCRILKGPLELPDWCRSESRNFLAAHPNQRILMVLSAGKIPPTECGPMKPLFRNSRKVMNESYSVFEWTPSRLPSRS